MSKSTDTRMQTIANDFETKKIGFDEKFSFHCTQCGACCINREDILLTPKDVFRMAKELQMTQKGFVEKHCDIYVGSDSRIPLVHLQPSGKDKHCPLLQNKHCIVHSVKPTVCALFPLGRGMRFKDEQQEAFEFSYFLQEIDCGDRSEEFTVREWLARFGMQPEDEFSIQWMLFVSKLSKFLREAEKHCKQTVMEMLWSYCFVILFFDYSMRKDFISQFQQRMNSIIKFIDNALTCKL